MLNELKPVNCGCGGKPIVHEQEYGEFEVYCPICFITTDDYKTKDKAIEAWNKALNHIVKVENYQDPAGLGGYGDCAECGGDVNVQYTYCPNCGGRLQWPVLN